MQTKRKNDKPIHVTIDSELALTIETEYHRLHQELLHLKRLGARSKRYKFTQKMVREVGFRVGIEKLKELTFEQFEHFHSELFS